MVVWLNDGQRRARSINNSGSRVGGFYRRSFLSQNEAETVMAMKSKPLVPVPYSDQNVKNFGYCCTCMTKSTTLCNRNFYQIYGWRNILNYPATFSRVFFHDFYYCCAVTHSQSYPRLRCTDISELKLSDETISRAGMKVVTRFLRSIETGFCMTFCRFVAYLFFKTFKWISRGLVIDEGRLLAIKDACRYLASQNNETVDRCPCVLLPLHASHLDYHILALIAFCNDLPLPFIGAGNNLDIPIFRHAIKNAGGFFIKRGGSSIQTNQCQLNSVASLASLPADGDVHSSASLYQDDCDVISRAVLRWTLRTLLSSDQNVEFYIEGTRTRNGRPMSPRLGLLSLLIDCLEKNDIPDICIVPTCLTYERVWELEDVINEQLGQQKQKETVFSSLKATFNVLRTFCGLIRVDFAEPFSLKEFIERVKSMEIRGNAAMVRNTPSPASTSPNAVSSASLLAQHVVYDCSRIAPITLTHALAFLILTKFRPGECVETIAKQLLLLRREIVYRGFDVTFCEDSEQGMCDAVIYAAKIIGPSVIEHEVAAGNRASQGYLRPCRDLRSVLTLGYYSSRLLLVFVAEAVVAASFVAATKLTKSRLSSLQASLAATNWSADNEAVQETADTEFKIGQNVIIERAEVLCRLLVREFIFVPSCRDIASELNTALNRLLTGNILRYRDAPTRPCVNMDVVDPQAEESDFSDDDEFRGDEDFEDDNEEPGFTAHFSHNTGVPSGPIIELNMMNAVPAAERLLELHSYLLPILEAQWVTACNIASFVDDPTLVQRDRDFIALCQRDTIDTYDDGNIYFAEAASTVTLSNAIKCFEHYGFLKRKGSYLELGPFPARYNDEVKVVEGLICLLEYFRLLPDSDYPGRSSIYNILISHLNSDT